MPTPRAPPGEKRLRFLVRGWGLGTRLGRSVGRWVDARGPVDHASVGLAQARPNKIDTSWGTPFLPLSPGSYNFCLRLSRWPGNQTCVGTTGATSTKEACWNCTLNSTWVIRGMCIPSLCAPVLSKGVCCFHLWGWLPAVEMWQLSRKPPCCLNVLLARIGYMCMMHHQDCHWQTISI